MRATAIIAGAVLEPMLLTTARHWPRGARWVLEPKWDGYRMLAAVDDEG